MTTFNRKSAFSIDVRNPDNPDDTGSTNCMIVLNDSLFTFADNFISQMLTADTIDPENKHPETRHSYQKIYSVGSANLCVARTIIQADSILKSICLRDGLDKQSILDHVWDCTKHLLSCEKALFSIYSDIMKLMPKCDEIINAGKNGGYITPLPQVPDLEDKVGSFLANGKRLLEKAHELLCMFYGAPNSSSNFQAYREWISKNQTERPEINRILVQDEPWITRLAWSRNAFCFNHSEEGNEVVLCNFRLQPGNKFTNPSWRYDFSKKKETEKQDHETDLFTDLDTCLNNLLYFFEELYLTCLNDNVGGQFGFEIFSIEEDKINPKCPIAFHAIPVGIINKVNKQQ